MANSTTPATTKPASPPVEYDTSLTRQTCAKLYSVDDNGKLQPAGQWCLQFTEKTPDILSVIVSLNGTSSMAVAMGAPMSSQGEIDKNSTLQLKNWLADILQQMNDAEPVTPVTPVTPND